MTDTYFDEIGFKLGDNSCLGSTESRQELDGEEILFYNDVSMYESDESLDMYTSKYTSQMTPGGGLRKTPGRPFDESPFRMQISQDVVQQMDATNATRKRSIPAVDVNDEYIDEDEDNDYDYDAPVQERKGKVFKKQYSDPFHAFFAQLLKADEDSLTFSPSNHKDKLKLQIQDGVVDDYYDDAFLEGMCINWRGTGGRSRLSFDRRIMLRAAFRQFPSFAFSTSKRKIKQRFQIEI